MNQTDIEDEKGRVLLSINDSGEIDVARFPDMSPELIEQVLFYYEELSECTKSDVNQMRSFLRYEGENEFCS